MVRKLALAGLTSLVYSVAVTCTWAQDAAAGRDLFLRKCIGCHSFSCNRDGPKLARLIGRQVGAVADYDGYTQALREAQFVWTIEALEDFFAAPGAVFPESTMASAGNVESPEDRKNLIAFLQTEDPSVNLCPSG